MYMSTCTCTCPMKKTSAIPNSIRSTPQKRTIIWGQKTHFEDNLYCITKSSLHNFTVYSLCIVSDICISHAMLGLSCTCCFVHTLYKTISVIMTYLKRGWDIPRLSSMNVDLYMYMCIAVHRNTAANTSLSIQWYHCYVYTKRLKFTLTQMFWCPDREAYVRLSARLKMATCHF